VIGDSHRLSDPTYRDDDEAKAWQAGEVRPAKRFADRSWPNGQGVQAEAGTSDSASIGHLNGIIHMDRLSIQMVDLNDFISDGEIAVAFTCTSAQASALRWYATTGTERHRWHCPRVTNESFAWRVARVLKGVTPPPDYTARSHWPDRAIRHTTA
jgi:hypothetical protein